MWGANKVFHGESEIENINKHQIDHFSFSYRPKYAVLVGDEAPKGDQYGLRIKLF